MAKRRAATDPTPALPRVPTTKPKLALRELHGHVTATGDTLTAWYVLSTQRWSFTTPAQREALIYAVAQRLANLAGHTVHLRVTSRPYPASEWAQALDEDTPDPVGGRARDSHWTQHLARSQEALRKSSLADKVVFLGVDLKVRGRGRWDRTAAYLTGLPGARAEIEKQAPALRRIGDIIGGPGLEGRPATTPELEWLVHRSVRLGLPDAGQTSVAADWAGTDMPHFTEGIRHDHKPFGRTVAITAPYGEHEVTRHVAVLTVGRMGALDIPQTIRDPWMQATDRLGFPVEWASTFTVLAGPEAAKQTEKKRLSIRAQQVHYAEHGREEPTALQRKAEHALRIEDETTEGDPVTAARCYGWHRLAVSGRTEEECIRRVQELRDAYQQQQITLEHPTTLLHSATQRALLTEFVPGETITSSAYQRRLPALYLAAGLPHVSSSVGDGRGPYMGHTAGISRRAFMWDPHYAMEVVQTSGLVPVVGGLGSGKSGLVGAAAYNSVLRGITTTILDPSGPLAALCEHPALAAHARHLDLVRGASGILSPYAVVAEPLRSNYDTDEEHREALVLAGQDRKSLALDVALMLLPTAVAKAGPTNVALSDAIRRVGGAAHASLWDVVEALEHRDDHLAQDARVVGNYLRDMAEMPQARLFFGRPEARAEHDDRLLVLTMNGISLPSKDQDPSTWSSSERVSVPLLHLASHFATARAYGLGRDQRKMVALDEAGMVGQWGSGRTLFNRLARDTRKWNIAALIASQNPADVLELDIANFISTAFVGRIEDDATAAAALRLLRIPTGAGYETTLASLSPQIVLGDGRRTRGAREFLVKDVDGNVERVSIDLSHEPELLAVLNTTADPTRARTDHPGPVQAEPTLQEATA